MMPTCSALSGQIEKFRPAAPAALTVHMVMPRPLWCQTVRARRQQRDASSQRARQVETSPMLREAQRKTLSKGSDPFANPVKNGTGLV